MNIPGFVDLQVNGYNGIDFSSPDLTEQEFLSACQALIEQGTTAFLPTIITSSVPTFERNLKLLAKCIENKDLKKHVLGIHVEGPFISPKDGARGAHNQEWVHKPDISLLDKLHSWSGGNIKLLTIAADTEGAADLADHATNLEITVSLGHQMATEANIKDLVKSGAHSLTHLGNGIPKILPRHRNPFWAGIGNDDLIAMIITDSHHLPDAIIKTIIRTKGVSKTIVVSDASPIAGLPAGRYNTLGNEVILEESGLLHNPETGYLVGSSACMLDCMNYLASLDILSPDELLDVGLYNPLKLISVDPELLPDAPLQYNAEEKRFVIS